MTKKQKIVSWFMVAVFTSCFFIAWIVDALIHAPYLNFEFWTLFWWLIKTFFIVALAAIAFNESEVFE